MKAYDLTLHKTFEFDVTDVDWDRTLAEGCGFRNGSMMHIGKRKWYGHELFFKHDVAWKYPRPFFVSKVTWDRCAKSQQCDGVED